MAKKVFCCECKSSLPKGASFCPKCGKSIQSEKDDETEASVELVAKALCFLWGGLALWVVAQLISPFPFWTSLDEDFFIFLITLGLMSFFIWCVQKGMGWARIVLSVLLGIALITEFCDVISEESVGTTLQLRIFEKGLWASILLMFIGICLTWHPSARQYFSKRERK